MEEENVQAQEEVIEQEEQTSEELDYQDSNEETQEESDEKVTLTKAEFNKLNRRAIAYEANKTKPKSITKPSSQDSVTISPERLDRIELMQEGYSKQEVDAIMELGGRKMLSNPVVQGAIQVIRQKEKSKNASEGLSSKSPVYKKYTQEDLNKLSSAEMEKILQG